MVREKWVVSAKKADFNEWAEKFGISPVLARIIRNRDVSDEEELKAYLKGDINDLHSPHLLKDMDKAADILLEAVKNGEKIRVIGDYDVDGICSTFIFTKGLSILGADCDHVIPHRIHDGYGLNDSLINDAKNEGIGLIATCDNGIAAFGQIELANTLGLKVVVTDHHEVPYEETDGVRHEILPPALAVVDPKQEKCQYPFKNICGGVVVYKLMQVLCEKTGSEALKNTMEEFLEFAALSTVCDVMELRDENRIIVREGIKRMKNSRNEGLKALISVNGLDPAGLSAYHLGFVIGPCLNATGRLDSADRSIDLLMSYTKVDALSNAGELKSLNDSRKNLTASGTEKAVKYVEENHLEKDDVLVIYLPDVHESLAGIIAGRIKELYNKPVFVLTNGEECVKGSGRSIEAYDMYEALNGVKDLFIKFGGHKMAAGLSLTADNVEVLRQRLNEKSNLSEEDFCKKILIDVPMPLSFANLELAKQLNLLEPFGTGNPKPLFAEKDVRFVGCARIGKEGKYGKFTVINSAGTKDTLMYFGSLERFKEYADEKFGEGAFDKLLSGKGEMTLSIIYQLSTNSFRGKEEKQFILTNFS
ncbi:MAG: single-stranded-DNA-specific exonuclease RecJ [Acetatifactor sp.]|nr:single-stranded-DNA-specific exonuclease RecJ [Acetatifactor sp.]